ncbi:MAG: glutaredoxin family protein [Gallionellaceae bacterium]|nr:glutaredoxin family protein [Gallionellaceae bacterium]
MKRLVLFSLCLLFCVPAAQAGKLYRWVDSSGKVHYGDAPPPEAAKVEAKKFSDAAPGENLPYETRRAQQNFPVTLYIADSCGEACEQARSLLHKRGVPFTEKNLVKKEEIDAFRNLSGSDSVPVLLIGRIFLKGFLATKWNDELDVAGYPKSAPYRAVPAPAKLPEDKKIPVETPNEKEPG